MLHNKKACETVKRKRHILLILAIFASVLLNNPNVMTLAEGQRGDAHIKRVEYPASKIYQYNKEIWNFTVRPVVRNENCAVDDLGQAWFFFKFYRDSELWWNEYNDTTYKVWQCNLNHTVRCGYELIIPTWMGPKNYDFKIELYWDNKGSPQLLDTIRFSVTCVLAVHPSYITVISYLFVYSLAAFLLIFYLLLTRPYQW